MNMLFSASVRWDRLRMIAIAVVAFGLGYFCGHH